MTTTRIGSFLRRGVQVARIVWGRRTEWLGKAIGASIGLVAGWFGLIVGLIVGYLTDELLKQDREDRALVRYLESPGPVPFEEPAPGVAAFCALATLVTASAPDRRSLKASSASEGIGIADRIAGSAAEYFGLGWSSLPTLESFVRVASLHLGHLNPDLLAESLAFRRRERQDAAALASALADFATGVGGADLVARIRESIGPSRAGDGAERSASTMLAGEDPWVILGLETDASIGEVKAAFRRLAVDVHPDSVRADGDDDKRNAAETFIRIETAYREIVRAKGGGA